MQCLARYKAPLIKGIKCVAFSGDGEHVVASGMDDDHSIAIFAWKNSNKGKLSGAIASGKGPRSAVWSLGFSPDGKKVVATCTREVNFYTFENGILKCTQGSGYKKGSLPGAVLCQTFAGNTLFTGCHDGNII
jgi:WD40 repeat protein